MNPKKNQNYIILHFYYIRQTSSKFYISHTVLAFIPIGKKYFAFISSIKTISVRKASYQIRLVHFQSHISKKTLIAMYFQLSITVVHAMRGYDHFFHFKL